MQTHYDICIAGAGMVGAAMAAALAGSKLKVLVVDPAPLSEFKLDEGYDIRVSAITRASMQLFQSLGIWDELSGYRVAPFRQMHVWEQSQAAEIHFDGAEIGEDALGYIIENKAIQYFLLQKLQQFDNIEVVQSVAIQAMQEQSNEVQVELNDGNSIVCQLLIGADGNRSQVRTLAGISTSGWRYDQHALVATVKTEQPHQDTAWQCFLKGGPLAFLPLADHYSSIVWSLPPQEAEVLSQLPEDVFEQQLSEAFQHKLGQVSLCSQRGVFPLQLQYANDYVKPGIALIGDAAHSIHPLAGQGVNLGLLDAACLADVIKQAFADGKSPGDYKYLRRYERWRKGDNLGVMFLMDIFKRLFAVTDGPVAEIRNAGMGLTNAIGPIKNLIMQGAAGMRGELPSLIKQQSRL